MRRGPKNLQISFAGNRLTHFGGVYLLYSFFKKIQLKTKLGRYIFFNRRNNQFSISEELLAQLRHNQRKNIDFVMYSHFFALRFHYIFSYLTISLEPLFLIFPSE